MKKILVLFYVKVLDIYKTVINDIFLSKRTPRVLSVEEAIQKINDEHYSMSRFGDGEISLITGESLKFQSYNRKLADELKKILQMSSEETNILVCIPDIFGNTKQYVPRAQKYWRKYLHNKRLVVYRLLNFDKVYYNALITRFYVDYADKSKMDMKVKNIQSIWAGKKLLIVEGEKSRLGVGNDFFDNAKNIKRIICPAVNAYSKIDEIENAISLEKDMDLVLIALGPTATVLAYRLHKNGIQALDIGHIDIEYEWYRKGAEDKEPVPYKYIGEIMGGDIVGELVDDVYESQIIRRFT